MQIIDSTVLGVRSAIWELTKDEAHPSITLFPMIHIAEPKFYKEVSARLNKCDLILYEGVKGKTSSWITKAYLQMLKNPKHGLVSQKTMSIKHLKERLIHADVDGFELDQKWKKLSFFNRIILPFFAPLIGIYLRWFGTRQLLASYMNVELLKARDEVLVDDDTNERNELIINWRDKHLIEIMDAEINKAIGNKKSIGIVYGARHMRAVIKHLTLTRGYRPEKSEWILVFRR